MPHLKQVTPFSIRPGGRRPPVGPSSMASPAYAPLPPPNPPGAPTSPGQSRSRFLYWSRSLSCSCFAMRSISGSRKGGLSRCGGRGVVGVGVVGRSRLEWDSSVNIGISHRIPPEQAISCSSVNSLGKGTIGAFGAETDEIEGTHDSSNVLERALRACHGVERMKAKQNRNKRRRRRQRDPFKHPVCDSSSPTPTNLLCRSRRCSSCTLVSSGAG